MLFHSGPLTTRKVRSVSVVSDTQCRASRPTRGRMSVRCDERFFDLTPIGRENEKQRFTGKITVGRSCSADLRIDHENIADIHAYIEKRAGRVYCTALSGDKELLLTDTWTWLQDRQLPRGVEYLCPPGGKLAFGDETLAYRIDFEEYSPKSSEMFFGNITQEVAALPITTDEVKKFLSKFKRTD